MKRTLAIILCVACVIAILNIETSTRQAVNYEIRVITMPLYLKALDFVDRHYNYYNLVRRITEGVRGEEGQVLKMFEWTHKNLKPQPDGMPVIDDHIMSIVIRGYGVPEQFQDVFTTLCEYRGFPAFFARVNSGDRRVSYALSFVKIGSTWRVFDAYNGKYFRTEAGEIAGIEDFDRDPAVLAELGRYNDEYDGVPCKEFYENLGLVTPACALRVSRQMPLRRAFLEIRKAIGLEAATVGR